MICPLRDDLECLKEKCGWWCVLMYENKTIGRCAIAWLPILLIELRAAVDKKNETGPGPRDPGRE